MPFDPNDPDTKAALDALKTDFQSKLDSEVAGLRSKNEELLTANKELKKGRTIDPADVQKLEDRIEEIQGKLTAAERDAKEAKKTAETATKALAQESGFTHKLLAENGIVAALTAAGVSDPAYLDAAKALHLPSVKVVAEGEERKALYGDKPLADAIKEWAAGDVGKKFVSAPNNSGGGAGGGGDKGGGGKTMTRAAYKEDPVAGSKFVKEGGTVVDQAA